MPRYYRQNVKMVEVTDDPSNRTLWKIATTPARDIPFLKYGTVPIGFRQVFPEGEKHPETRKHVWIKVTTTDGWLQQQCTMTDSLTVHCGYYRAGPLVRDRTR
jgi:hypothetical protein